MKTKIELNNVGEFSRFVIEIRLDDECKNGHEDFAITGTGWYKSSHFKDCDICGCVHEEILKLRPDLKIFVDLHLCDRKGVPMYAVENGFYHLKNKPEYLPKFLMLLPGEFDLFKDCPDKLYFQYLVEKLQLPQRWQDKANGAILLLEQLTGEKYVDNSKKDTYIMLTPEQLADVEQKIADGFYSPEQIGKRKADEKAERIAKKIKEIRNRTAKKYADELMDDKIHIWALMHGFEKENENMIFYNHTRQIKFNWKGYGDEVSAGRIEQFRVNFQRTRIWTDGEVKEII
jgi:hypothetical protein